MFVPEQRNPGLLITEMASHAREAVREKAECLVCDFSPHHSWHRTGLA